MVKKLIRRLHNIILSNFCPACLKTKETASPITIKGLFYQKILGFNRNVYWPAHFTSKITHYNNIEIGIGTAPGLSPGCYIQGGGGIKIGNYTIVAPNVGIISSNHDLHDSSMHINKKVVIGNYCWIAMNSVVLPGVVLGDYTIVGAGSIVTKSFKEGYCVIGGNPAKIIRRLDKDKCKFHTNENEYYGYIKKENFIDFKNNELNV